MASSDAHGASLATAIETTSSAKHPTVLTSERLQGCSCGNILRPGATHCRKCGRTLPRAGPDVPEASRRDGRTGSSISPKSTTSSNSPKAQRSLLSEEGQRKVPRTSGGTGSPKSATSPSTSRSVPEEGNMLWALKETAHRSVAAVADIGEAYARRVSARFPCLCSCCSLLIVGAISGVGVVLYPMQLETNFDKFMKTDAIVSRERDAFEAALQERTTTRRLARGGGSVTQLWKAYNMEMVYKLKESSGFHSILDAPVVTDIARLERSLFNFAGWKKFCNATREYAYLCNPGVSVVNHMFPTLLLPAHDPSTIVPDLIELDGKGRADLFLPAMVHVMDHLKVTEVILPASGDLSKPGDFTEVRSAFHFKVFCCTSEDPSSIKRKRLDVLHNMWVALVEELLPKLEKPAGENAEEKDELPFLIYYDGTNFEEIEVMRTLSGDIIMACASMVFVLLYMIFHTGSGFLSVFGIIIIMCSIPLSYTIFAMVSGSTEVSLAMCLSLFLVIGLGSDVIFVFTDFWRDSARIRDGYPDRLVYTIKNAGKASFATSSTTAGSFVVNLVSVLKPLREFGLFMGLCIMLVWLLILGIYAPLCIVDEKWFHHCNWQLKTASSANPSEVSGWRSSLLSKWAGCLHPWRRSCLLLAVLSSIGALISAAMMAEIDSGLPNIFPEDHNRNAGKKVFQNFESIEDEMDVAYEGPESSLKVCKETKFDPQYVECPLFWCQTASSVPEHVNSPVEEQRVPHGSCQCWQREWCSGVPAANMRFFGVDKNSTPHLATKIREELSSGSFGVKASAVHLGTRDLAPVLIQDWESGNVEFEPVTQITTNLDIEGPGCGFFSACFCGTYICQMDEGNWQSSRSFHFDLSRRLTVVQQPTVPVSMRTGVDVVFGLEVDEKTTIVGEKETEDMWSFLEDFDISAPWTQRNLYSFCTKLPEELRVFDKVCIMEEFRDYMVKTARQMYPVAAQRFYMYFEKFFDNVLLKGSFPPKDYCWIRESRVKGLYMNFAADFNKHSNTESINQYKRRWDEYVNAWNANASVSATGAWHTSQPWVRAEAQMELVSSTLLTLGLCGVFAFVSMLVFTVDPVLSIYVVCATMGVISGLTFFMLVLMGWAFGPIEVIALIVFIGYALDYSLHIAHKYSSCKALRQSEQQRIGDAMDGGRSSLDATAIRFRRTNYALQSVGGAALGSAITTVGCSLFLILCTLSIFRKLGVVVLAVTIMSIVMAFGPLTSALFVAGPLYPERNLERLQIGLQRLFDCMSNTERAMAQRHRDMRDSFRRNSPTEKQDDEEKRRLSTDGSGDSNPDGPRIYHQDPRLLEEDKEAKQIGVCSDPTRPQDAAVFDTSAVDREARLSAISMNTDGTLPPMPRRATTPRAQPTPTWRDLEEGSAVPPILVNNARAEGVMLGAAYDSRKESL